MIFKKSQLYLIFGIIALIVVLALVAIFQGENSSNKLSSSPLPALRPSSLPSSSGFRSSKIKPILISDIPFKPESQGGGVDLDSLLVQESQAEVARILPFLPYQNQLTDSSGKTISILIPGSQYQTTPWVLDVQIFGIDYQVSEGDSDYQIQRSSFLVAVLNVFEWIRTKNLDPEKIIINWGDKAFIRDSAEKWLNE